MTQRNADKILEALNNHGKLTNLELVEKTGVCFNSVCRKIRDLRIANKIHIEEWRLSRGNQKCAVWSLGPDMNIQKKVIDPEIKKDLKFRRMIGRLAAIEAGPFRTSIWNATRRAR